MTEVFKLCSEWPWDIIEMMWFRGWKVKDQGHRVNMCIFHTRPTAVIYGVGLDSVSAFYFVIWVHGGLHDVYSLFIIMC